jgi:enoyl-CoA hydratase/carnithine racemase
VSDILISRHDRVAIVTISRPKRNALAAQTIVELNEAIAQLDGDDSIRALILTGADPAFSAGFDLTNLAHELAGTRATDAAKSRRGLLIDHDTPIVGAINGPAVTGGLELALGCDFLIASERAAFADTHGRVGIVPGGGMSIRLPELIGVDRARRMTLTGEFVSAQLAYEWGLVTEVVAHDQLLERSLAVASAIAELAPPAVAALRALYEQSEALAGDDAWRAERAANRDWMTSQFDSASFAPRAKDIIERGSHQIEG